jgi:PAS domain S-box-containing protein
LAQKAVEHMIANQAPFLAQGSGAPWNPRFAALDAISDLAFLAACAALLIAILVFAKKRSDLKLGGLAGLFGCFILLAGLGYALQSVALWLPGYGLLGWMKTGAALAAIAAVVAMLRLSSRALAIPGPNQVRSLQNLLSEKTTAHAEALAGLEQLRQQLEEQTTKHSKQCVLCKERFEALLKISAQVVWEADAKGEIVEDSPSWRAFTGQSVQENRNKGWRSAIHPDDLERARADWRRAIRERRPFETEFRLRNAAGEWRAMAAKGMPLFVNSGEAPEWIGLAVDITEQEERRTKQREFHAELQQRIDERTAQLERAQKLEALGWLTGGAAHDFNNLLSLILGNMRLLQKRLADDERSKRLIRNAADGAERGMRLTQLMLAFSPRPEQAAATTANLAQLTKRLTNVLRGSLGPGVRIERDVPESVWPVKADVHMLQMALVNLAVNARDAMPSGGALAISARNEHLTEALDELAPGDYVRITVTDTGRGMDQATLARATEPFFTTKDVGKGSGLGLSMVRDLATKSGGALRLTSTLGEGSTVKMWLPRASEAAPPAQAPAVQEQRQRPASVLVVDDDALSCMATADMLADLGFEVTEANSGYRALEVLRSGRPIDVVVADHAMPGMTGLQLARAIRADWPDLPILMASGFADLTEADGMDLPRLDKPYDQKTLAARINELLAKTPASK